MIPKKPNSERQAQAFIAQADTKKLDEPYPITLRLSRERIDRIDSMANRLGITRSGWIKMVIGQALEKQE